ncbi:MAG: c-type cytochrome [Actinobacteria bacterium]|nr:c-type cytochrome [Actinomycetota bacterium]
MSRGDRRRVLGRHALLAAPLAASAIFALVIFVGPTTSQSATPPSVELGALLFDASCSSCHGANGEGIDGRGPSLKNEGRAAADFVLRTGRMPLADPSAQAKRGPVRFTEEEILALVEHVGLIGDGVDIPNVDITNADLGNGGSIFRLNCAACHVASAAGAPIGGNRRAPSLALSTPTEVGEAILTGPGSMPVFGVLTEDEINDVAGYVENLAEQNTTGALHFGGAGPVAEGLAAWILALIPMVALTRWIGRARSGRDPSEEDTDAIEAAK